MISLVNHDSRLRSMCQSWTSRQAVGHQHRARLRGNLGDPPASGHLGYPRETNRCGKSPCFIGKSPFFLGKSWENDDLTTTNCHLAAKHDDLT